MEGQRSIELAIMDTSELVRLRATYLSHLGRARREQGLDDVAAALERRIIDVDVELAIRESSEDPL